MAQYLYEDEYLLAPTTTRTKYADDKYSETKATYDPKYGEILTSTDAKSVVTTYSYDELGRPYEIYYPSYNSDSGNKYVKEQYLYSKDGEFNSTYYLKVSRYVYDSSDSEAYDTVVSSEIVMCDDYGNIVYRKDDIGEKEYIYDDCNRAVQFKDYNDFGTDDISASCTYDNLSRITSSTDKLGNNSYATYKLLSNEYYFIPEGATTKENHSKEYYDIYGNIIKTEVYPDGESGSPVTATFTYDLVGNVLTSTDANGNTASFEYDELGNNVKTVRTDGSIVENQFTKWGTSRKTTVVDGENRYSSNSDYEDDRGFATSIYSTGIDINTKPWYNEYDVDGSLLKTTAPNANTINYLYDNSGNLTQTVNGSQRNNYTYAFDGQVTSQSKYVNDTVLETAAYNYDSLERLTSKVIGSDTTAYTYNTMGSVTSVTSPTGFRTAYTLDEAERVTGVTFDGKEIAYEYYGDGMVKKITYPNSITTEYSYDNANRVTDIVTKLNGSTLRSYSYTYDGNGNVLTVGGSENVSYTYDTLNRLVSSTKNGVTTVYTYDSRNNLISETDGTNTTSYEYGGDNRLHKVNESGVETVYEYDLNGNLIKRGEDVFAYDENNRLVYSKVDGVETTYEIGVEGLRKSKTTNGETTSYKYNESGYVLVENGEDIIYGNTALAKKSGADFYYYLYNAHGDVTAIVDETGNIVNSYEYDPWGKITSQTETVDNSLKYAGEYYDEKTGLIYLRNRYYDPNVRRFTSEDPARDEWNWYCYCGNNPVNFVDPSGLAPTKEEAAYMAEHIYGDYDMGVNGIESRTVAGWRLIDIFDGGASSSIKLGVYIPDGDDWANPSEYALVFRGSTTSLDIETASVWANNLLAYSSSASVDMWAAIGAGIYFDATHSQEITFVGHSKGGGEAIAAATATNNNAITFNAANFDFSNYGLIERNKSGIINYYINGEVLSSLPFVGKSRYGTNISVKTQYWNEYNFLGFEISVPAPIKNHEMDAFKKAWGLEW